jgi:hypothetical protein
MDLTRVVFSGGTIFWGHLYGEFIFYIWDILFWDIIFLHLVHSCTVREDVVFELHYLRRVLKPSIGSH